MKINIVSKDLRYIKVNELLLQKGYDSFICALDTYTDCDCLVLSVANELSDGELRRLLSKTDINTLVLSGNKGRIEKYFAGRVIDYSKSEELLLRNAKLTAEATVTYLHSLTKASLNGKKIFVAGYGRISKELCQLLQALGSQVYVYARRESARAEITNNGYTPVDLVACAQCDIVINTVPANIFSSSLINAIPKDVYIVELASAPYGFENMERVSVASALPGKILPISGAYVIFDTIDDILSSTGKDNIC